MMHLHFMIRCGHHCSGTIFQFLTRVHFEERIFRDIVPNLQLEEQLRVSKEKKARERNTGNPGVA